MKRTVLSLIILFTGVSLWANPFTWEDHSVALVDDIRALSINPAALAYESAGGIGFLQNPGNLFDGTVDFSDNLYILAASSGFGWLIGKEAGTVRNTGALAFSPFTNLYLGGNFSWTGRDLDDYLYTLGFLLRPVEAVSLGGVYRAGVPADWSAGFGIALRPLWFLTGHGHRLEIGVDLPVSSTGFALPVVHLRTEPVDGVSVEGSWNSAAGTFRAGLSLSYGNLRFGGACGLSAGFEPAEADYHIQLNPESYRSVLSKKKDVFLDYNAGDILNEHPGILDGGFASVTGPERTVWSLMEDLRRLKEDDSIRGIVFRNRLFQASRANFHELQAVLEEFRAAGKKIIFYYEDVDTANYTLAASVADKIYLNPLGTISLSGAGSVHFYYNDLFRRLGVETVDLQSHDYKTANNSFTKSTMTEAEREALMSVYMELQGETERRIDAGRNGRLADSIERLFDHGPYLVADDALEAGLVDDLIYEAELDDLLREEMEGATVTGKIPQGQVRRTWADPYTKTIALIYATGAIYPGEGMPGRTIGSDTLVRALREARGNPATEAIVLRVDSPGGSAIASDIIAREIGICRAEPYNLPVVVSMGAVAGSGGYYISCMSDYIYAHPDTITGSIGVAGFNFNIKGLLEKIDVEAVTLVTREKADLGNSTREMTEEEFALFRRYILHIYDTFVDTVALGRNMERGEVHEIGKGRIWTGIQAVENGLIDELGVLDDAVAKAKELAGITGVVSLKQYNGFVFKPSDILSFYLSALVKKSLPEEVLTLAGEMEMLRQLGSWKPVLMVPYRF